MHFFLVYFGKLVYYVYMIKTIDITPTWESAVKIYIAVLENDKASAEAKHNARAELTYIAKTMDRLQAVRKAEAKAEAQEKKFPFSVDRKS